jgi:cytochrome c peroxidase
MLHNKYMFPSAKFYTGFLQLLLACTLSISFTHIEANENNKLEPIYPIPQNIEVNTEKANIGEQLFFDTRLSRDNSIACATCHQLDAGGDDNLAKGISISGESHVFNTPSIFNALYNFRQNWEGSIKTPQEQIDDVVTSQNGFDNQWQNIISLLSTDKQLTTNFRQAYSDGINKTNIIDALVEFEKTLITPNSRFDRYLRNEDNALSRKEIEGYIIFKELGCVSCHQGINIGGNLFQKFGVFYDYMAERGNLSKHDYGRFNTTNRLIDQFVFKVPSLRNVAVTAPYLHDGSAKTLDDAISIMGRTQIGRTLTMDEVLSIKAFLITLTGEYKNTPLDGRS